MNKDLVCVYLGQDAVEPKMLWIGGSDFLQEARRLIGCDLIQTVRMEKLGGKYLMLVDEEFLLKENTGFNPIASFLYGMELHHEIIAGHALIVKTEYVPGEGEDLAWLTPEEAREVETHIRNMLLDFSGRMLCDFARRMWQGV